MSLELHHYQEHAVDFILKKQKCALFLDLGLGKTAITLTAVSEMLDLFAVNRVLVIAPLRVSRNVWAQEAAKWDHLKHLKVTVAAGLSAEERKRALMSNADIHVLNVDLVQWLITNIPVWRWDMIVIDESSGFKSSKSKRFRALKVVVPLLKSIVLLTGTPSPNGYMDLWSQLYLVDQGERLGRNITQYRSRWFTQDYMGWSWGLRENAEHEIQRRIADVCLRMESKDYLELPELISLEERVVLPANVMKQYREIEKEFLLTLDNTVVEVTTEAVLSNKLIQIANGAVYSENGDWHEIHTEKIDRLKELVQDNADENFFVAYLYKSDLARIRKAIPEAQVLTDQTLEAWNKGKVKILLAHPASAAHGLNLQYGGSVVVWFGISWNLEHYQQFNARLHRQGQTKPVRIIHIVASGTIDEKVTKAVNAKAKSQKDLLDYLKGNK